MEIRQPPDDLPDLMRPNGMPVGQPGTELPKLLVLETWEGQLIASTQQPMNGG